MRSDLLALVVLLLPLIIIASSSSHDYDLRSGTGIGAGASSSSSGRGSSGIGSGASSSSSGSQIGSGAGRGGGSGVGSGASPYSRGDSLAVTVKGQLKCGHAPAVAHVRLYPLHRSPSDDYVDTDDTNAIGDFHIDGNTGGRVNATLFEPMIAIYHQCDLDAGSNKHRHFKLYIPMSYVNEGRIGRKPYDIGKLNLQLVYPKEDTVKDFDKTRLRESLLMLF